MFGWGELGIIAILAIILLGPDKLPEVFRTLGKIYGEYKKAKRRFELELIYGYEIPSKELIDELARKRMEELGINDFKIEDFEKKL
ncbi:translocase [Archaeoglobales archaeon]|nr:MAG: translocase [Archaeoglobales archaeon]